MATLYLEDLTVGLTRTRVKVITQADISAFGAVSGDLNPVHFCDDFAAQSPFGGVVAHGMLSASLFSAVIGEELPGHGAIYLGQTLKFHAPVRPGDRVVATCRVQSIAPERRRVFLECACHVEETLVLSGEAEVMAPRRPQPRASVASAHMTGHAAQQASA